MRTDEEWRKQEEEQEALFPPGQGQWMQEGAAREYERNEAVRNAAAAAPASASTGGGRRDEPSGGDHPVIKEHLVRRGGLLLPGHYFDGSIKDKYVTCQDPNTPFTLPPLKRTRESDQGGDDKEGGGKRKRDEGFDDDDVFAQLC